MKQEYPSLVLLDIMLPDEDGLTILKKLRDTGSDQTASGHHADGEGNRV